MPTPTPYSTSEKRAIESGLYAAYRRVESSARLEDRLERAMKYERQGRPSLGSAQAIMCQAILDGIENAYSVADLAELSEGCLVGAIIGAYLVKKGLVDEDLLHRLRTAQEAQRLHIERYMKRLAS